MASSNPPADARRVIQLMRRITPEGCAKPWRTAANVAIVAALLGEHDLGELEDHVRRCAELVASGREDRRWWYVGNVFGARTLERWTANYTADGFEDAQSQSRAEANQANLRAVEQRRDDGPGPKLADLDLRRIIAACNDARARSKNHGTEPDPDTQPADPPDVHGRTGSAD